MNKENEKLKKKKFSLFWVFLEIDFLAETKKFSPFFFKTVGPIDLKIFLQVLRLKRCACFFFFLEILVLKNMAFSRKISTTAKAGFSARFSVFCFSCLVQTVFLKEKNPASHLRSRYCRKNFSLKQ